MSKIKLILFFAFVSFAFSSTPLWLRYPSISPDGKHIAFNYQGQIWLVPRNGGVATPLTDSLFYDSHPIWSNNSKKIAYTSDRYGNLDIFLLSLDGVKTKRLTFHSQDDTPMSFTNDDKQIIFSSPRISDKINQRDSIRKTVPLVKQIFKIPTKGGKVSLFSHVMASNLSLGKNSDVYIYEDKVAPYESKFRKHNHTSSTSNIWIFDGKKHIKSTEYIGDDKNPIFTSDKKSFYYLSDKSGSLNVWKKDIKTDKKTQITFFKKWPVRFLSLANDGTLVFTYDGKIWSKERDKKPRIVPIKTMQHSTIDGYSSADITNEITEFIISPNEQEAAVIARGEVFVINFSNSQVRRITNSPGMERFVSFSPDGKALLYASEDLDGWKIKQTRLDKNAKVFSSVYPFYEEVLVGGKKDVFKPIYSPNGDKFAYIYDRDSIRVYDFKTNNSKEVLAKGSLFNYHDGDIEFTWGKNEKYLIVVTGFLKHTECKLIDLSNNSIKNLTNSGFTNSYPQVSDNGHVITWISDISGVRNLDSSSTLFDVFASFLDTDDYRNFLNAQKKLSVYESKKSDDTKIPNIKNIDLRKMKFTPFSLDINYYKLSPDNTRILIVTENGKVYHINTINGNIYTSFDIKKDALYKANNALSALYTISNGTITRYDLKTKKEDSLHFDIKFSRDIQKEVRGIFEHNFRATKETFYDKKMHGVDWDKIGKHYRKFLPYIAYYEDLMDIIGEMAGELNASHLWSKINKSDKNGDNTASFGLFYDFSYYGEGMKIKDILIDSPAYNSKFLKSNSIILAIDGIKISKDTNIYRLLNRKANKEVLLEIKMPNGDIKQEVIAPIDLYVENLLAYYNWQEKRRELVSKLSDGTIGYIHVPSMGNDGFRKAYKDLFGRYKNTKGAIIDIRDNGGGNLTQKLLTLITGKRDSYFKSKDGYVVLKNPTDRYAMPTVVLVNENSYSDASIFPSLYQYKKFGKIVGSKVPGTGTYVTEVSQIFPKLSYHIPILGLYYAKSEEKFENKEIIPDFLIDNNPNAVMQDTDLQLQKAVEILTQLQSI